MFIMFWKICSQKEGLNIAKDEEDWYALRANGVLDNILSIEP